MFGCQFWTRMRQMRMRVPTGSQPSGIVPGSSPSQRSRRPSWPKANLTTAPPYQKRSWPSLPLSATASVKWRTRPWSCRLNQSSPTGATTAPRASRSPATWSGKQPYAKPLLCQKHCEWSESEAAFPTATWLSGYILSHLPSSNLVDRSHPKLRSHPQPGWVVMPSATFPPATWLSGHALSHVPTSNLVEWSCPQPHSHQQPGWAVIS